jgi:hypothetical protein
MADPSNCPKREKSPKGGYRIPDATYDVLWIARVRSRVVVVSETGCWLWQGWITKLWGYAQVGYRGRPVHVHRKLYMVLHNVQLSRDQYVCHTCDVRHCVNPDHLWLGSNSDNQKDSSAKSRHYESRRTHCERGHEFSPENTIVRATMRGTPRRVCRICERIRYRISLGWTEEEAATTPRIPNGFRTERGETGRVLHVRTTAEEIAFKQSLLPEIVK